MALEDFEVFLQERARVFDENLDLSPGSPFDVQVIQPVLRRLGQDPFTVDYLTFVQSRLNQEFPDLATKDGDALTDLLIKTTALLFDPIIRENQRIKNSQSFRDPTTLTVDEAEALGANLFSERERGSFAKTVARVYFAQPQSIAINPSNFATSKGGLHFYPTSIQSIRVDEMLLNVEGSLYYFDINLIAEKAGDEYNIGPDEISTIANVASAVRITNKRRARFGLPEENAVQFVDRTQQELTERSLVTLRGITARITKNFSEVTRLAVVGFNDPEMHRDVISGGSLGDLSSFGKLAAAQVDGEGIDKTRRISIAGDSVDLTTVIGPAGDVEEGWVFTLVDGFLTSPIVRDLTVTKIISSSVLEVAERVVAPTISNKYWTLRKKKLTVSGIPGGILFPDGPNGTVDIPSDAVHIGGATDIHVRGSDLDTASVTISAIVDDSPILSGVRLQIIDALGHVSLADFTLDTNYTTGDGVFTALEEARAKNFSIAILEDIGGTAGTYRILAVTQTSFASPLLTIDPPPPFVGGALRWRLLDSIDIDLIEPKETRVSGSDLGTVQNTNVAIPASGIDLSALGVSIGDTLRVDNGPVAGDYSVIAIPAPFFDRVQVDRNFTASASGLSYSIFRPNTAGGIVRPLVRVTSIDLLDTSGQPVGSTIPYAKVVDARSSSFSNFSRGVRVDVRDARLGITGIPLVTNNANVSGQTLLLGWENGGSASIIFTGSNPISIANIITQINTAVGRTVASIVDTNRVGIIPIGGVTIAIGTALPLLFGISATTDFIASDDVRSDSTVWKVDVSPVVSSAVDVFQVLDGFQIGFYNNPSTDGGSFPLYTGLNVDHNFYPEARRHIQLGFRSIGTARVFFLEPTSVEFSPTSIFTAETESGVVKYFPDPTINSQRIPGLPFGDQPKDGNTTASLATFSSGTIDFIKKQIKEGDLLEVTNVPITGTASLADPVALLALTSIVISIDGGVDKTITFIHDSNSIPATSVTRAGIAAQINRAAGKTICSIIQSVGLYYLEFETDSSIVIQPTGTSNTILGFSTVVAQNNDSPNKGMYTIVTVLAGQVSISGVFVSSASRQMFKVFRPGSQRISSTQMRDNTTDASLYYFDVELVSEGTGDLWNIPTSVVMTVDGYDSDGYYLTTEDTNLSFSVVERPHMVISRSILEVGVSDDPENATQLSGQNIQVNYDRSALVANVNNFILAETERVVNESPLARHLTPFFVRVDLTYSGGSKESEVIPDVEEYVRNLFPNDSLEVSDLENILSHKGASSITNPVDLVAVVHNFDRSISLERSNNKLNTGRLAAFIPDVLNIKRKTT